jgi:hypothetical protein
MIMSANTGSPKFALGRIVATPGALEVIEASGHSPADFITRHVRLEQGDLCDEDHQLNAEAVKDGSRILSSFKTSKGERIWVISEAEDDDGQRAATTLLLPEE